ncbi:MAG: CoA transferase [Gammaproteobacteria bacterium]|nr:CoA transferase [Gammaproteobacteria bacterium]
MTTDRPLSGIRIADFTQVFAGPFCTHQLVLLGAEAEKIEPVGVGDILRKYKHGGDQMGGTSGSFISINAGKKSIELDLKNARGREVAERMVATADVVVENFRAGVMTRLGFSWERCRELNPRIVYASLSGYGADGPMKHFPAYDHNMQAMSGMMTLNGAEKDPYMKVGFPLIDSFAGYTAAFAILAALRQRDRTGEAQYVDIAMLDASIVLMTSMVVPYMNAGRAPPRTGNRGYSGSPTADVFAARNGQLSLGANWPYQYEALCQALGLPELIDDARFATRDSRIANEIELRTLLEAKLQQEDAEFWEDHLNAAGVPASKVRTIAEAVALEQLQMRNLFQSVPVSHGDERSVKILNNGFRAEWNGVSDPSPLLGEHTDEILSRLGFNQQAIESLRAEGVVGRGVSDAAAAGS